MAYRVQDRLEISLFFNNREYPFEKLNTLDFMHIGVGTKVGLPMLHLSLTDNTNFFNKEQDLADGALIAIIITAQGMTAKKSYAFRLHSYREQYSGGGFRYQIDGYLDAPMFWNGRTTTPILGTSFDALKTICGQTELNLDGYQCNDTQLWRPQNYTWMDFSRKISERGWLSDTSCMQLGVELDKTMIYRDLNDLVPPSHTFITYQYTDNTIPVVDFQVKTNSGFNNKTTGYWDKTIQQSVYANGSQAYDKLTFTPNTKVPLFNEKMKTAVKQGRVKFGPIDCGNVHESYEKALYQNIRYANLFSFGVELLTLFPTDVRLMDRVVFNCQLSSENTSKAYSGVYTVSSRAIYVQGANYYEKISAVRHGINNTGGS